MGIVYERTGVQLLKTETNFESFGGWTASLRYVAGGTVKDTISLTVKLANAGNTPLDVTKTYKVTIEEE